MRILFVVDRLTGGGVEQDVRLLARTLDPARYAFDVVACLGDDAAPDAPHGRLEAAGVRIDRTPRSLPFDATVAYLAGLIPGYDAIVSCRNVADVYPALRRGHLRPPLIEHGERASDPLAGPKHLTDRYVGAGASIRDAAASVMPGRGQDAIAIAPMIDPADVDPAVRARVRATLGIAPDASLIGWFGRLDGDDHVADLIAAAALIHAIRPEARLLVVGYPDAGSPANAVSARTQAGALGVAGMLHFPADGSDIVELLSAIDIALCLSPDGATLRTVAAAGAAALPVIAAVEAGSADLIENEIDGLLVARHDRAAATGTLTRLLDDLPLRRRLGAALQAKIRAEYSVEAVAPAWRRLFDAVRRPPPPPPPNLFSSFFLGGFECSTHRRAHDRRRVDVIAATGHDRLAEQDYRALQRHGMRTARDGLRWHRIEQAPGRYDWSSLEDQLAAAEATGMGVIWDLLHYGWPDDIDIWSPTFVERFTAFAAAAARMIGPRTVGTRLYCPINEISFLSWAGGEEGCFNPFARGRGFELKVQLARAAIAAMDAIRAIDPHARFIHVDPIINVIPASARPGDVADAEGHRQAQFQGWDLIAGRLWPQIGGRPELLDIVGVNYYHNNQWLLGGPQVGRGHPLHKPLHRMLAETYARYGRPIFVAETGIEGDARPDWLAHICDEVRRAQRLGVPVGGLCLYPILDHPGWDDDRPCPNGLFGDVSDGAERRVDPPLAAELARQAASQAMPAESR